MPKRVPPLSAKALAAGVAQSENGGVGGSKLTPRSKVGRKESARKNLQLGPRTAREARASRAFSHDR